MVIKPGHVVRIECELKVHGGDVIESSKKSGPIEYKHGGGQLLTSLEKVLEGLKVGDEKKGTIPAKDAFGGVAQLEQKLSRASFPADAKIDVGTRFEAKITNGTPVILEVAKIDGDDVRAKVVHTARRQGHRLRGEGPRDSSAAAARSADARRRRSPARRRLGRLGSARRLTSGRCSSNRAHRVLILLAHGDGLREIRRRRIRLDVVVKDRAIDDHALHRRRLVRPTIDIVTS